MIMKDKETLLLICRELRDLYLVDQFREEKAKRRVVVASDDVKVHVSAETKPWVDDVCFIEQMKSYYHVASDVIVFLEVINQWLKSLGDDQHGITTELLFWIRHAEGGMTTQRIQDLLLLIKSYLNLLDTYKITSIIILSHSGMQWEDHVLIETARSRNIDIKVIGRLRIGVLMGKTWGVLKTTIAREPYYIFNFMRAKFRSHFRFKQAESYEKEIVFQLCSSAYKHSENIIPLMKALKDKKYNPVALCWQASGGADRVRGEGLRAEELEKTAPISSIWTGHYLGRRAWKKARTRRKEFRSHPNLYYQSVPLGHLLWPSVKYFFTTELAQRYRFFLAIKKYFDSHSPLSIKLWGGGTLIEGDLVVKHLKGEKNKPLFTYWFWTFVDSPYESKAEYIDLFLAAGDSQKNYLEHLGVSSNRIALVGMPRYDHLLDFRKLHSPEQSFFYLSISSTYSTYVLYDPNVILRGYLAVSEQVQTTEFLLDFARRHPSMALIIKPHPGYRPGLLESLIDSYSLQNVFLVDKSVPPYHALNVADFLITKFSTIGIEAMLFGRPVISVLLDSEGRFKIYEDAAEYVTTIEELNKLLTELLNDASFRSQWTTKLIEKQKFFLKNFLGESTQHNANLAANAIDDAITRKSQKVELDH